MNKQTIYFCSISIILIFAIFTITQVSCQKDACANVACENGSCGNGICNCLPGYSGINCETAFNAKFFGTYIGTYTDSTGQFPMVDSFSITAGNGPYGIVITDYGNDLTVNGSTANDSITIPRQQFMVSHFPGTVFGSGAVLNSVASITYTQTITGAGSVTTAFTGIRKQ